MRKSAGAREVYRQVRSRLRMIQHYEQVTRNVRQTCRFFGISRCQFYVWLRRYRQAGCPGRLQPRQALVLAGRMGLVLHFRCSTHSNVAPSGVRLKPLWWTISCSLVRRSASPSSSEGGRLGLWRIGYVGPRQLPIWRPPSRTAHPARRTQR